MFPSIVETTREYFRRAFHIEPQLWSWAPGRVNIIGEHTDYNGGLALPFAINRGLAALWAPANDLRIHSTNFRGTYPTGVGKSKPTGWLAYAAGAVELFQQLSGRKVQGRILIHGDLPPSQGLSSSAALELVLLNLFNTLTKAALSSEQLIDLAVEIEHRYVGVASGRLDQTAIQFARPKQAQLLNFTDGCRRHVEINLPGCAWVVIFSGIKRNLVETPYDQRVTAFREGIHWLKRKGFIAKSLLEIDEQQFNRAVQGGSFSWESLVRHVIQENERVRRLAQVLEQGSAETAGKILTEGHWSLARLFQVSTPDIDFLISITSRHQACLGARLTGAGFGGAVLALVPQDRLEQFEQEIIQAYQEQLGRVVQWFTVIPSAGPQTGVFPKRRER